MLCSNKIFMHVIISKTNDFFLLELNFKLYNSLHDNFGHITFDWMNFNELD